MTLRRRFISGLFWNFVEKLGLFGFGLIVSILIARGLGPSKYGVYASVLAVIAIFNSLSSFGFEKIINVYLPRVLTQSDSAKKVAFLVKKLISLRFIYSLIGGLTVFYFATKIANLIKYPEIYIYLKIASLHIVLSGLASISRMIFRADLKNKIIALAEVIGQFIFLILVVIFLRLNYGISGVISSLIISTAIPILLYSFYSKIYLAPKSQSFDFRPLYKLGFISWLVGLMTFILGKQVDIILLNYFKVPSAQIGFYSLAFSLITILYIFGRGLGPIAQSVFSEAFARDGSRGLSKSFQIIFKVHSVLLVPTFVFAIFYARIIIDVLYAKEYLAAVILFQTFILFKAIYDIVTMASFCPSAFYVLGKKNLVLIFSLIAGLLNLLLDIILIPYWGVMGAIIATGFSIALIGFLEIGFLLKELKFQLPLSFLAKITIICLISIFPSLLIQAGGIISLILKMFIYFVSIVLLMFIIKPFEEQERNMLRGIHPWIDKTFGFICGSKVRI